MLHNKLALPKKFIEDVFELPYNKNTLVNPEHEKQIGELLKKHNIRYKFQPNGTQDSPDFYLPDYDLNIECKSFKNLKPMWNLHLPKQNSLYIICSKQLNKTVMFFGEYILSKANSEKIIARYKKYKKMIIEDQKEDKDSETDVGFWIYPRLSFDSYISKLCNKNYKSFYFSEFHKTKLLKHFNYEV